MRAALIAGALAAALVAAAPGTLAHPGHGLTEVRVGDDFLRPASTRIFTEDTVVWRWLGPGGDHSVTADPGQAESFDSDPGKEPAEIEHAAGYAFTHRFTHAGSFTYHCRVHPSMRGEITAVVPPPRDRTRPGLTAVGVRPKRLCPPGEACRLLARLRFTLSEAASVVGRIDRRRPGRWRLVHSLVVYAAKGRLRRRLRLPGLDPGLYRLRLVAYDYSGNASRTTRRQFRLSRRAAGPTRS